MSSTRREPTGPEARTAAPEREEETQPPARPRPYVRTVYPLNPGIPHYVDFPRGWR